MFSSQAEEKINISKMDYYEILQVSPSANDKILKKGMF
jgi:hypothetical protein